MASTRRRTRRLAACGAALSIVVAVGIGVGVGVAASAAQAQMQTPAQQPGSRVPAATPASVVPPAPPAPAAAARPAAPPPSAGPDTPLWRSSLGTAFQPLSIDEALAKAEAEHKLVCVFVYNSTDPDKVDEIAHMRNTTWKNPTLASYLGWRFVTIELDAAFNGWVYARWNLNPFDLPGVVALRSVAGVEEIVGRSLKLHDPLTRQADRLMPGHLRNTVPDVVSTATTVLFQMDFAHERLAARDPAWGLEADQANPMPKPPPADDPLHQVEDRAAIAVPDPGPDDRGWRAGGQPAAPVPMANRTKRIEPTFNNAPYDVMERLVEARAAIEGNDARLATGMYTWLWEKSEAFDPASRAFRRCILPAELRELASVNDFTRERFSAVRDHQSKRLLWAGFGDLMTWFTLNEICGDDVENALYLDLYMSDRDEAAMMPRGHSAAYQLITARDRFIDPWRIDRPSTRGARSAMPADADGAALAHVRAVAQRLGEARKAAVSEDDFEKLQAFRREYLIDETARLHTALLRTGRDSVAREAIEVALKALPEVDDRAQLLNSAVFCALAADLVREMHAGFLRDAAALGRANLTLELRMNERRGRPTGAGQPASTREAPSR